MEKTTLEEAKKNKYYEFFISSNLPLAFIAAELKDYDTSWLGQGEHGGDNLRNFQLYLNYINNIGWQIEHGMGLFLAGSFGVGKTMLEVIAMKKTIDYYLTRPLSEKDINPSFSIGYLTGAELVELYAFGDEDKKLSRRSKLKTIDVLAIDELTRVPLTGTNKEKVLVEEVIRSRAFALKTTIITSQANAEQTGRDMSLALPELIREYFVDINFIGPSWREHYGGKKI